MSINITLESSKINIYFVLQIDIGKPLDIPSAETVSGTNDHLLYSLPASVCEQLVTVQFLCVAMSPVPPILTSNNDRFLTYIFYRVITLFCFVEHSSEAKEGLYGTTLMRDLEAALEFALTPLAGALDSRAKDILVAFEQEV